MVWVPPRVGSEHAVQSTLNRLVEKYAEALEFFDEWEAHRWKDNPDIERGLADKSNLEKIRLLRLQIEMRTVGCGWRQFETKWGYDPDGVQHTISQFKAMLKDIIAHELTLVRAKRLPQEAAPPQVRFD